MVYTGLDILLGKVPAELKGKKAGILCHAPSITGDFIHVTDHFHNNDELVMSAIFGPQHGLYGQTQDNMIEWEGYFHPRFKVPVYSLYGENRKPTRRMIENIEVLIVDLQDVGARLYTYAWTLKLCMEACSEQGIPVWVLDRPNPIAPIDFDGPVLKPEFFTFVGGASIPLCHRMTIGEIAFWIKAFHIPGCELRVIPLEGWNRRMLYSDTSLRWVFPSPNMPALNSAIVYPGMVLIEALNLSEGRGTTLPFELFGAPWINSEALLANLKSRKLKGCSFRMQNYIPTFHKYHGQLCNGMQIHVTDYKIFRPVETALEIFSAIFETTNSGDLKFIEPPYEYENNLIPFDILSGDSQMRRTLVEGGSLWQEKERWRSEIESFRSEFRKIELYTG